jgi:DNA-binding CsgD family transcriptional regulator
MAAMAGGDPERARALAEPLAAAPSTLPCLDFTVLGEAQVAVDDPAGALGTAARLAGIGPGGAWPMACAARIEGLARAQLGERDAALGCLERAVDGLDRLGMRFEAARARLDRAEVAAAGTTSAQQREIAHAARHALFVFDELDARPYGDRARRLLRRLGERPPARPRRAAEQELTARELEVVRLVAAGLSNAEIGARLFISPRTVTTHLQHVYARLGLGSRTALTRWVVEQNLAGGRAGNT